MTSSKRLKDLEVHVEVEGAEEAVVEDEVQEEEPEGAQEVAL